MLERKTVSMCVNSDYCRGWNDAVKEMPKWISVKERMPPLKEKVLVWAVGKSKLTMGKTYCDVTFTAEEMGEVRWWECWMRFIEDWDITHWMPLPDAPEVEDE